MRAADDGRAATRLLDPRDRLRRWPGGLCGWVRAQIVGDDGASWVCGDLLYTLGWALSTGVVVVIFLQVLRRQYEQLLDAYEAGMREKTGAEGEQASEGGGG